jgi:plastocyanin domain-containing protein
MKATTVTIIIAGVLIAGFLVILGLSRGSVPTQTQNANNVSMENGKQVIEISAKGGYQLRQSVAKAGIPTILRFNTSGTFDCSSSIRIPSMNISKALLQTGTTDVDIGSPVSGVLQGTCGMGMYRFDVSFQK